MKIVGTVAPEAIPEVAGSGPRGGLWTGLARQVIAAHAQGQVLVVQVPDRQEYRRMVNGIAEYLRNAGFSRTFTTVDGNDGVTTYCQIRERTAEDQTVVVRPLKRVRRRANG